MCIKQSISNLMANINKRWKYIQKLKNLPTVNIDIIVLQQFIVIFIKDVLLPKIAGINLIKIKMKILASRMYYNFKQKVHMKIYIQLYSITCPSWRREKEQGQMPDHVHCYQHVWHAFLNSRTEIYK